MKFPWQCIHPIDAILFDCDGTLSQIEGIDELAKHHQVIDIVQRITRDAMGKSGMSPEVYAERLDLTKPNQQEVDALVDAYYEQITPDVLEVIEILQRLNKSVFIVSAGLFPSVAGFAKKLKIPKENIFAVNILFDEKGQYCNFDHTSPMVFKNGKQKIVSLIKNKYNTIAFIGDGLSDYEVCEDVTRFVGYGGVFYRENIAKLCQFYIKTLRLRALLPLLLTTYEYDILLPHEKKLYAEGIADIENAAVKIQL